VAPFQEPGRGTQAADAAIVTSSIVGDGESETILEPVEDIRERVSDPDGALAVAVTGPAGSAADAIEVFESINATLLLAALGLVIVLLILIYRSPIFWLIPIFAVVFAELATRSLGYGLTEVGVTINGQSSSILSVLVLGAGTDYALLLVSRYKEELRRHADKHEAMAIALRTAGPAIVASGSTVIAALLCLTLAEVEGTAGLGPIGALGVFVAMVTMLTCFPRCLSSRGAGRSGIRRSSAATTASRITVTRPPGRSAAGCGGPSAIAWPSGRAPRGWRRRWSSPP
jgi:RND superfamily putative drug exporter